MSTLGLLKFKALLPPPLSHTSLGCRTGSIKSPSPLSNPTCEEINQASVNLSLLPRRLIFQPPCMNARGRRGKKIATLFPRLAWREISPRFFSVQYPANFVSLLLLLHQVYVGKSELGKSVKNRPKRRMEVYKASFSPSPPTVGEKDKRNPSSRPQGFSGRGRGSVTAVVKFEEKGVSPPPSLSSENGMTDSCHSTSPNPAGK